MIFESEEAQTLFHGLPAQVQCDWLSIDEQCMAIGYPLKLAASGSGLQIRVWVNLEHINTAVGFARSNDAIPNKCPQCGIYFF